MQKQILPRQRPRERGQTMIFVAISIVSLLALAALAIDIVTLYVARTEIQRAADAAALAAAKAIADSGVTSLQAADAQLGPAQTLAQNMATAAVTAMINPGSTINLVAGAPPTFTLPPIDFTRQGNPHVTIALTRSNLPTFFSKIWARSSATVTATATAEVYNPGNVPTFTPISPKSVKPWLVANADPTNASTPFIDPAGNVEIGVIGKQFNLTADCQTGFPTCQLITTPVNHNPPIATPVTLQVDYVPLQVVANSKNVCPACAGASDYEQSIECADVNTYVAPSCGGGIPNATWDSSVNPGVGGVTSLSASGAVCLTHATSAGVGWGQDTLNNPVPWPTTPFQIQAGSNNPQNGNFVATSSSIVTIPIIQTCIGSGCFSTISGPVTVIGFMQAFINWVQDGSLPNTTPGDINITVLNIAGCSASPNAANPVVGGAGTSPVPVRLITPP